MMFQRKTALVTGGRGALGSRVAERLVHEGCRVFASSHSGTPAKRASEASIRSVTMLRADCMDETQVSRVYDTIIAEAGSIHVVVNTVGGYLAQKPLTEVTAEEWDRMMNINLKSAFLSTREALRRMRGQSYGRVINISAMTGLRPSPERIPYSISKASVSLLTELVAQEVKGTGITVNAIAPSIIGTDANLASMPGQDSSKWVTPDQIADLIVYLCSPSASAVTGTTIKASAGV